MRQIMLPNLMFLFLLCLSWSVVDLAGAERSVEARTRLGAQKAARGKVKKETAKESPFTCNVSGLSAAERERWEALLTQLNGRKQEVRELADGYAFRFPSDAAMVRDIAEFITYERSCCPFFDFEIAVEREGGPIWLRLKGRRGVKAFIRSEFGL